MNPKPMESFPASANLRDPVMTCLKHPHRLMYVSTQSPAGDAVFGSCGTFVTQCLVGICKQVGINHLRVAVQSQSPYSYLFPSLATNHVTKKQREDPPFMDSYHHAFQASTS